MKYKFFMLSMKKIGNKAKKELVRAFHGEKGVYEAAEKDLLSCGILPERKAREFYQEMKNFDLEQEFASFQKKQLSFVTCFSPDFPEALRHIYDAPYGLFYRGRLPEKGERIVAMVGARRCSAYGRLMAEEIAGALAQEGFSVVSGMARGIDRASHLGCLSKGGKSYAFLGCGADVCYPAGNRDIYDRLPQRGCIFSELLPGSAPLPQFFPPRNRLISGLSDAVVVLEAKERSGSLITADFALEQGKDVYALPGRVTDSMSVGTNGLISQGAGIICSAKDLIENLKGNFGVAQAADTSEQTDFLPQAAGTPGQTDFLPQNEAYHTRGNCAINPAKQKIILEKDESMVYSCFDFYAKGIDGVQEETGLPLPLLLAAIVHLCELGLIKEVFQNQYVRCSV